MVCHSVLLALELFGIRQVIVLDEVQVVVEFEDVRSGSRDVQTDDIGVRDALEMLYDATEDAKCRECKFLPVCMGGCPNARLQNSESRCTEMKHGLDYFMSVIPSILESQIDAGERKQPREEALGA